MPRTLSLFLAADLALLVALVPAAWAAHGVVDLSWDRCSPVVSAITRSGNPVNGGIPASLFISVIGNDQTHDGYQVRFQLGSLSNTVPDAWRFDPLGCPGSTFLAMNHLPPVAMAAACPAFQGPSTVTSVQIKDFDFFFFTPGSSYPEWTMRGVLANAYPPRTSNPLQRQFLAEFRFDLTYSINGESIPGERCGGLETPMIVRLLFDDPGQPNSEPTSYHRADDGQLYLFGQGNTVVTVNGAVPAEGTTWGQIKSAYRR